MKSILKTILKYYLKYIAKLVLLIHKPKVIAIAGSINKHFVKQEIKHLIEAKGIEVRANAKNFNTEIGLPLAILDLPSGYNSYKKWLPIMRQAFLRIFVREFPPYLVLGLGSSDPGDMEYLLTIVKPEYVIITDITQRYAEGFNGLDDLLNEYVKLAQTLDRNGVLILNADNQRVLLLKDATKAKTITFSIENNSDYKAEDIRKEKNILKFKIQNKQKEVELVRFGKHHVYAKLIGLSIEQILFNRTED